MPTTRQLPVYTRGGDKGQTALATGARVRKDSALVCVYGTVDELNACVGLLHDSLQAHGDASRWQTRAASLRRIQHELFNLGTEVAALPRLPARLKLLTAADTKRLETEIDTCTAQLPALRNFILPRGHALASQAHVCRTVCRRAERELCALLSGKHQPRPELISYLNRLSDWFFTLARHLLHELEVAEELWTLR